MAKPTYDEVNSAYQQYLGRGASDDEYNNWVNGSYGATDLPGITSQIQSSGEANDYRTKQGTGTQPDTSTQPTPPPTTAQPASTQPTYDQVNQGYQTNLGRSASQDEYQNWLNGSYGSTDLNGILGQIANSGEAASYASSTGKLPAANPGATFTGFDPSRLDSNTLKYNAMQVLQHFNPNDPNAMAQAYAYLNAKSPGQYQLDAQGNLMLTGTADGYIGARPIGWGSGGAWQDPNGSNYDWQWLAYNQAHPGPNGEGKGSGSLNGDGVTMTGGPSTGANAQNSLSSILSRMTGSGGGTSSGASNNFLNSLGRQGQLGSYYGGPGTAGVFNGDFLQQMGQDPFSQAITGSLAQLMGTAGSRLGTSDQDLALMMERARMPYEMARKTQLNNARADLANRGLLSTESPGQGLEGDALQRIETGLAPSYTAAIDNGMLELNQNEQKWADILGNAATAGTNRQNVLGTLALNELSQNTAFNEFLANYGLDRDKTLYEMQSGQNNQILQAFQLWLQYGQLSANGYV